MTNQVGLENVTLCAFVGETIELNCATDDNEMVPLEITAPDGSMANGSLIVSSVDMSDEGTYSCRLSKDPGPCGQATEQREVRVFGECKTAKVLELKQILLENHMRAKKQSFSIAIPIHRMADIRGTKFRGF